MDTKLLDTCTFITERLTINLYVNDNNITKDSVTILTPNVVKYLPSTWGLVNTLSDADNWINERVEESSLLTIINGDTLIGYLFLYGEEMEKSLINVHIGYLFGEEYWGKGFATELLRGFVHWAEKSEFIKMITGGVEKSNVGSIKVLEKCSFRRNTVEKGDTVFYEYTMK